MSEKVRFTWAVGGNAGRVLKTPRVQGTTQNTLTFIAHQWGMEVDGPETALRCEGIWFPTSLCPVSLAEGTVECYPEFCPVWDGDVIIACLLRPREEA